MLPLAGMGLAYPHLGMAFAYFNLLDQNVQIFGEFPTLREILREHLAVSASV